MTVYKYRTLQSIERIYDIIINEQLYCSKYHELNDPFEGEYNLYYGDSSWGVAICGEAECGSDSNHLSQVQEDTFRICSLSIVCDDLKMWSFYSDGHKGICIEIELFDYPEDELFEVRYNLRSKKVTEKNLSESTVKRILSRKSIHWKFEQELRLISKDDKHQICGRIVSVFSVVKLEK